jgi:polyhydroxyalkanoate synthase
MTKRDGPHPLWLHLNGGAAMMAAASDSDPMFKTSSYMLQKALDGVKKYQESHVKPFTRDMECVFEVNGSRALKPKGWQADKYVLLVPSLINSWHIFDIEENHSFMTYLYNNGFCPIVIEWAYPTENISIETYICSHLEPIVKNINADSLIGYCMGGTIIAALYTAYQNIKHHKIVLIAPPWDFDYQSADQKLRIQSLALQTYIMGNTVPRDFIQSLFWAVDPLQVFKKFQKFPEMSEPERFVRVEDWLNDGHPVSTSVIQTCLFDWYRDNKIVKNEWKVRDNIVNDKYLPEGVFIIAGQKDNLVPVDSIKPLLKNRSSITVDTGHIGLMASNKALEKVWKPITQFLNK